MGVVALRLGQGAGTWSVNAIPVRHPGERACVQQLGELGGGGGKAVCRPAPAGRLRA